MNGFDDFDTQITCEEFYEDVDQEVLDAEFEDEEPDVDSYTEYQDLPWGGDDQFETCSYSEDF
jgi:hypothetical protein